MLGDYKHYLTNLRNSLIQCGVEFPVSSLDSYLSVFEVEQYLRELLWFYSQLEISNSESKLIGFMLPLNGYFKEKMRELFYSEFLQIQRDYGIISKKRTLREKGTYKPNIQEVIYDENEVIDLFEDEDGYPDVSDDEEEVALPVTYVSHGVFLEDLKESEGFDDSDDNWSYSYEEEDSFDSGDDGSDGYEDEELGDSEEDWSTGYEDEGLDDSEDNLYDESEDDWSTSYEYEDTDDSDFEEEVSEDDWLTSYEDEDVEDLESNDDFEDDWSSGYEDEEDFAEESDDDEDFEDDWSSGYEDEEDFTDDSEEDSEFEEDFEDDWSSSYDEEDSSYNEDDEEFEEGFEDDWSSGYDDAVPTSSGASITGTHAPQSSKARLELEAEYEKAEAIHRATENLLLDGKKMLFNGLKKLKNSGKK